MREIKTESGRVYQAFEGESSVRIEWTSPVALGGHTSFTRGMLDTHPEHGRVVRFAEQARQGRKLVPICATLKGKPTLAELVVVAERLSAELRAEYEAEAAREQAEREDAERESRSAFEAGLPADYIAIEEVDHNPSAADGWGSTSYRHAGVKLGEREVDSLDAKYYHTPGNSYALRCYVPRTGLDDLLARKAAERRAKQGARAAKQAEKDAARQAAIEAARATGKAVQIGRWSEPCDGSACECDLDVITQYAEPDGSISHHRSHTH